ncbi:MAG TPA: phosphoribosylglycinamide formyltransferase [Candidatus Limnocylindria bacterium]|nr:phosphoribosylglycinamide formyltransferase [Candidatus Limnocylindria bacterium]
MTFPVAVCVSGRGTNLQALIDATAGGRLPARIVLVASSRDMVPALARAKRAGLPYAVFPVTAEGRGDAQRAMGEAIVAAGARLVVLAGYDRILADPFWGAIGDIPVINIHPSLLPAFGGLNRLKVHEAVLAAGVKETGATVHRANRGKLDEGEIIVQRSVPVLPGDDPLTLEQRVLETEHAALVEAVARFARDASAAHA